MIATTLNQTSESEVQIGIWSPVANIKMIVTCKSKNMHFVALCLPF